MDLYRRSNYSFHLPDSLIAAFPLERREHARLLVIRKQSRSIEHAFIHDLPRILPPHSLCVVNNTKVIRARLRGARMESPGKVEFFLLKKLGPGLWQGLMKSSARIAPGFRFWVGREDAQIAAEVLERNETNAGTLFTVKLAQDPVDAGLGEVPLPPYIIAKREKGVHQGDELETYNTVFAKQEGSVAAPTAGRHFTSKLISELIAAGMGWEEITLHVGMGTFKPVMADDLRNHTMHGEFSFISAQTARTILAAKQINRPIIAVGTTTTRTLEGRARGEGAMLELPEGEAEIDLFIHPGSEHSWKMVDGMLTNFHLPESTLLMMVASFIGDLAFTQEAYQIAIRENYRFYSYGDAMLILP